MPMTSLSSAGDGDKSKGSAKRVAVVGAGVSGLAAAYRLKLNGVDVTVFEADARVGGKLRSISRDGLIWDEGANTMTESESEVRSLLDELGLREKQQFPISQFKRYVVKNGKPVLLPSNPIALLMSDFLSSQSKFKIILEPLLWEKRNPSKVSDDMQESVGQFFERHFGSEVVDYLIDPFVAGTSGGDPVSLSISHCFPELWNIEKRFGSIIGGAIRSTLSSRREKDGKPNDSPKTRKAQRGSFSFYGGMQTLADTLYEKIGKDNVKLQSKVLSLSYDHHGNPALENWSLVHHSGENRRSEESLFDALVMTAPLCNFKELVVKNRGNRFPLDFIPEVDYLPVSAIVTTFRKQNVKRPLEGFGVLVPSKEQKNGFETLGTLFSSMMFPDRAPSDLYLYTTFVGGSRNRELAKAPKDELKQIVTSDIRQLLGVEGEPTSVNHYYWSKAFPLYGRNYDVVLRGIEKMEKDLPGLFYAGNNKDGLSVGKAIASGCRAADLVLSYLNSFSDIQDASEV